MNITQSTTAMPAISKPRELVGEDCAVVCALSGNFVQRGDFAVFQNTPGVVGRRRRGRSRRRAAAPVCASSAERFARGGVCLLDALGVVTHLSFGSESGELPELAAAADC